jgi:hypothetical protein
MACESQFPADINLSCIIALAIKTREGISLPIIKEWLWTCGALMEKFSPPDLPPTSEVQAFDELSIESLTVEIEELAMTVKQNLDTAGIVPLGINWAILLPLALKLLEMLLKKQLNPTPAPAPAPATIPMTKPKP